jgi:hypothetical protein
MSDIFHHAECIDDAIHDMAEKLKTLRAIVDATSHKAEGLTANMHAMTQQERFDASMEIWRHLTKIGSATMWLDIHKDTARRHTNSILEATAGAGT